MRGGGFLGLLGCVCVCGVLVFLSLSAYSLSPCGVRVAAGRGTGGCLFLREEQTPKNRGAVSFSKRRWVTEREREREGGSEERERERERALARGGGERARKGSEVFPKGGARAAFALCKQRDSRTTTFHLRALCPARFGWSLSHQSVDVWAGGGWGGGGTRRGANASKQNEAKVDFFFLCSSQDCVLFGVILF